MQKIATRIVLSILFLSSMICSAIDKEKFINNPKLIVFDVQGTLIDIQNLKSTEHFGYWNSARALFQGDLNDFYTDMLGQIPSPMPTAQEAKGLNGKEMPALQSNYLLGKISGQDCIKIADSWIENNKNKFANEYQINLFKSMLHFYFEPKTFLKYQKYTSCMDLMKKLFDIKTKDDKRKNVIAIISNQSKEQVDLLKEMFPDIFKYSDIQLFSCNEGCLNSNNALIDKALSMCPEKSYYVSFVVDNSSTKDNSLKVIRGHKIESLSPKQAETKLVAYGAMSKEIGI